MAEAALSPNALYSARPTVRINGTEQERVNGLLTAIEMNEHEDGLSTLEMKVENVASDAAGNSDFAFEDEATFKLGDTITVYLGEQSAPTEIFRGIISALEGDFTEDGAPTLTALAEDTLQKARLKRRTKTFDDQSIADIARSIAGDLGLTPQISGFSEPIGTQVQLNESDLAFLRRLLARYDGDLQVVGSELHVSPRRDVRRGTVELALHSQLRRVSVLADLAHQVSEVTVTGWDPARGQRISSRSTGFQQGPGSGRWGGDLLSSALGQRAHQIGHLAVDDRRRRARARGRELRRAPAALRDRARDRRGQPFDPRRHARAPHRPEPALQQHLLRHAVLPPLRPGAGLRNRLHRGERLPRPAMSRARELLEIPFAGLFTGGYLAEVINLDDPESLSRVQLRVLNFDGVDSHDGPIWARVACAFAGNNRGSFLLPDVGDEVLVVFVNGDPRFPVVVGGLWNGSDTSPETISGGRNRKKVIRSKNGVKVTLDDQDGQEQFIAETPGGQKITLKDGPGAVWIEDSNGNSVKLETAGITVTASAKVTVNASTVEISAGMVTVNAGMSRFSGVVQADTVITQHASSARSTRLAPETSGESMNGHEVMWTQPPALLGTPASRILPLARAALKRPAILRFNNDDFMDEFMNVLDIVTGAAARVPGAARDVARVHARTGAGAEAAAVDACFNASGSSRGAQPAGLTVPPSPPAESVPAGTPLKLYQPAHQRHYLVASSLVCGIAGLPDRGVEAGRGEQIGVRDPPPPAAVERHTGTRRRLGRARVGRAAARLRLAEGRHGSAAGARGRGAAAALRGQLRRERTPQAASFCRRDSGRQA